ncbi:MAG TPA: c-type cytochrome biogenesis protein CcsB [Mycobacteriales bacterium]|nr:c-type cytochrome biogenesis protein CcsB [Mycobacteriales bacterium]
MFVNAGLARLSDHMFTWSIILYSLALVAYCGEYAFGRRGKVAATSPEQVLVGAGGLSEVKTGGISTVSVSSKAPPKARNRTGQADRFGRIAVGATVVGLGVELTSLLLRGLATHRLPWGNMYEFSAVVGAAAVIAYLVVLIRLPQVRYLGMFLLFPVVVLLFLAGTVLYAPAEPLVPALRSYWIAIHVTTISIGTGIFMVSFVATVLYLIRRRWELAVEAGKTPTRFPVTLGSRMPTTDVLDRMAYRTVAFGFPVYTFGIIAGAIWAEAAWGRYWGWDPKETWAFITWVVYAAYLHARATAGWRGTAAARVNMVAFSTMIFNFFIINMVVSGLHSYAGLT